MFRVIGKILVYLNGIFLFIFGVTTFFFMCFTYVNVFSPLESTIGFLHAFIMIGFSILAWYLIRWNKKTWPLIPGLLVILGVGIYYLVHVYHIDPLESDLFYKIIGYISIICSSVTLLSCFWNRK